MLDPARPGRSIPASDTPVLSQQAGNGRTPDPLKFGSASSLSNSHRFASRCARWRLPRPGWLAADAGGSFEAVAVDVAGEVADEPGVLHAEGGGSELGIEVGDELGDASLAAERRGGARGPERPGEVALVSWAVAGARGAGDDHVGVEGAQGGAVSSSLMVRLRSWALEAACSNASRPMSRSCGCPVLAVHRRNSARWALSSRTLPVKAGWLPSWRVVAGSMRMSLRRFAQPKKPRST